jgi:hypothetical protein
MNSQSKDAKGMSAAPGAASPAASRCLGRRARSGWTRFAAAAVVGFSAVVGCNSVLGIDDATLCGGSTCDGGVSTSLERTAPADVPNEGASGGRASDASAPRGNGELGTPTNIELVPSDDSADPSSSGGSNSGDGNPSDDDADDGNPGNGNPGGGNPGNGNPGNGNPGGGNPGNGNPGSGGASSGGSGQQPPSACADRAEGTAFCDGATRIACGAGGTVTSTLLCPSVEHCSQASGPTCAVCRTGEALCSGAALSVCNLAHTGFETQACAAPDLCNAAQARCEPPVCGVGQMRCDGALLQVCNAALTGFDTVADCISEAACNLDTETCNVCTPNARRCVDSNTTATCDANGQSEVLNECTVLVEECSAGVCELILF